MPVALFHEHESKPERGETREKTLEKTRGKTDAAILRMLSEYLGRSVAELAESLGKVLSTIDRAWTRDGYC